MLLGVVLIYCSATALSRDRFSESEVAVALLYNVTKFVQWPQGSFAGTDAALKICTYPSEDYRAALQALEQRSVGARPIEVVELPTGSNGSDSGCHVLFFTSPEQAVNGNTFRGLDGQAVLTVGNYREFAEQGGMLSLAKGRRRVNIRINATASKRAGLEYNSQLLELATVFKRNDGGSSR
ncbi:MAG: YfiR family protein [Halieaceae bacterium]